jgi:hypothetical protein
MSGANSNTAEWRKVEREALLATLGEKVATPSISTEWIAYLRFVAAFRRYSFNDLMLIAAQCPHASMSPGTAPGSSWAGRPQGVTVRSRFLATPRRRSPRSARRPSKRSSKIGGRAPSGMTSPPRRIIST